MPTFLAWVYKRLKTTGQLFALHKHIPRKNIVQFGCGKTPLATKPVEFGIVVVVRAVAYSSDDDFVTSPDDVEPSDGWL